MERGPDAVGVLRRSMLGRPLAAPPPPLIEIFRRPLALLPPVLLRREKTCGNTEPVVSTAAPKLAPSDEAEECAGELSRLRLSSTLTYSVMAVDSAPLGAWTRHHALYRAPPVCLRRLLLQSARADCCGLLRPSVAL